MLSSRTLRVPHKQMSFMEMVKVLTQNIHAIRTSNWTQFKSSLTLMLPLMQIYDNEKCGRHLPDFTAVLDTLPADQAAFMESGMFAQSMTGKTIFVCRSRHMDRVNNE